MSEQISSQGMQWSGQSVTIAICTWNRAELLAQTLNHLRELRIPEGLRWEVLVVDNNSTDRTRETVETLRSALPLRYVFEPKPGISHARNRALREAASSFLLFTDDDVLVDPGWMVAALETWRRFPDATMVGGPIEPWFPSPVDPDMAAAFPVFANGFCGLDHGPVERALSPGSDLYTANLAIQPRMLGQMSFDESLGHTGKELVGGEDLDFVRRIHRRGDLVAWSPAMRVRHYVDPRRMTLAYVKRFYFDDARCRVRMNGVPGKARIVGAPLWLWRQVVATYLRFCIARVTSSRRRSLLALRDHMVTRGMFVEACASVRS